jgi:hypothetical protein
MSHEQHSPGNVHQICRASPKIFAIHLRLTPMILRRRSISISFRLILQERKEQDVRPQTHFVRQKFGGCGPVARLRRRIIIEPAVSSQRVSSKPIRNYPAIEIWEAKRFVARLTRNPLVRYSLDTTLSSQSAEPGSRNSRYSIITSRTIPPVRAAKVAARSYDGHDFPACLPPQLSQAIQHCTLIGEVGKQLSIIHRCLRGNLFW